MTNSQIRTLAAQHMSWVSVDTTYQLNIFSFARAIFKEAANIIEFACWDAAQESMTVDAEGCAKILRIIGCAMHESEIAVALYSDAVNGE